MEETPEKTRSHPLKTAKTLLLGAVLCIVLGCACFIGGRLSAGSGSETPRLDAVVLETQIRDISELASVTYTYTNMAQFESSNDFYGVKIPFTQTEIIYSYDVAVKAGLDFDQVEWEVNDEAKEIQVTMPEIRVLSSEVDLESFKLYHENWSNFRPIRTEEFSAAAQAMKVEAQNRAVENGLLDNAQENAERVIQGFIHQNFDPQEYKIVFEYEKGAAA